MVMSVPMPTLIVAWVITVFVWPDSLIWVPAICGVALGLFSLYAFGVVLRDAVIALYPTPEEEEGRRRK
jgi:hypothetical protein